MTTTLAAPIEKALLVAEKIHNTHKVFLETIDEQIKNNGIFRKALYHYYDREMFSNFRILVFGSGGQAGKENVFHSYNSTLMDFLHAAAPRNISIEQLDAVDAEINMRCEKILALVTDGFVSAENAENEIESIHTQLIQPVLNANAIIY